MTTFPIGGNLLLYKKIPWAAVTRASRGARGATDWELLQIKLSPQAWERITWYSQGKIVSNPFA